MASGNMKDIKTRIRSVQSTMQITKAMELVASSKLRRAKSRMESSRPYFAELERTMKNILIYNKDSTSDFIKKREIKNSTYIVIAGDRGLAGGYNSNILKLVKNDIGDKPANIITVGKKSADFFAKQPYNIVKNFLDIAESLKISDAMEISSIISEMYINGDTDEIYIAYTEFISPMTQEAKIVKLLPMEMDDVGTRSSLIEYDPSPAAVFDYIVPRYFAGVIFGGIVESFTSEQAARRMAMESASDNANEMISSLNLSYNRARQFAITQEITEIVAGSTAIK